MFLLILIAGYFLGNFFGVVLSTLCFNYLCKRFAIPLSVAARTAGDKRFFDLFCRVSEWQVTISGPLAVILLLLGPSEDSLVANFIVVLFSALVSLFVPGLLLLLARDSKEFFIKLSEPLVKTGKK